MRKISIILSIVFFSLISYAEEEDFYEYLLAWEWAYKGFEVTKSETGIDLTSEDKLKTSNGVELSKIQLNLEGPFQIPVGTTLEQAMNFNINSIIQTTELNKSYEPNGKVADGIGAVKVDVNGFEVGYLDYQVPALNMAKIRRAVIVKDNRLYGFTIILHDPTVDPKRGMVLDALVIEAVNSGKL